jgi:hypothetical protein
MIAHRVLESLERLRWRERYGWFAGFATGRCDLKIAGWLFKPNYPSMNAATIRRSSCGLLPTSFATWLIRVGGQKDAY